MYLSVYECKYITFLLKFQDPQINNTRIGIYNRLPDFYEIFTIMGSCLVKEIVDKSGALWYNLLRLYIRSDCG